METGASPEPGDSSESEAGPEFNPQPRPPAKLERLQKILAAAGVASRRRAEELIEQGRVQVNGKVVTVLGTKADAARDHIRVDGKLLQGAERLRYFVLNKPRGYVTTVRDPEGRPTVMQFFEKMKERLYPVGRLDYMSEGLLVVTNDGELANRLTKASSGVEKTYLVKVAGQPTEAELNILRGGVAIDRGAPGSAKVHTSPARIRQVRQGDNPWYEVILIEGRNRELRKMFEEVGHFVEKIRRVGYGPLVLDQEPGNLRELEPEELERLRQAAEGKLRTPKAKELRRRNAADAAQLPTVAPRPSRPRPAAQFSERPSAPFSEHPAAPRSNSGRPSDDRPRKSFGAERQSRPPAERFRPASGSSTAHGPARHDDRPRSAAGAPRPTSARPSQGSFSSAGPGSDRPSFARSGFARPSSAHSSSDRPGAARPFRGEGGLARPFTTSSGKPRVGGARPSSKPGGSTGRSFAGPAQRSFGRGQGEGSFAPRPARPSSGSGADRPGPRQPSPYPSSPRSSGPRSSAPRQPSSSRPYTPRAEGASDFRPSQAKPYPNAASRAERKAGPGWKPKRSFGGKSKPASAPRSKPTPHGFSQSGYKGKPNDSSGKRTGPRPSGKRPGKKRS
jgi:23S rRNA pseudouridine2605 synthase